MRTNDRFRPVSGRSLVAMNVTPILWKPALIGISGVRPPLPSFGADLFVPVEQVHACAVDRDLELLALHVAEHGREVAGHALHREHVVAVGRELVLDQHAAARAERQPFDVTVLRGVVRRVEHGQRRRGLGADGQTADLAGRRQVRLHQRGRRRQRAGHVVEPVARIVGRQERRGVDVQREQVADRVRVFGAVQPVQARGRQMRLGVLVDLVLEPGHELVARFTVERRAAVRGRHQPGAKLADDLLPGLGVRGHVVERERLEVQVPDFLVRVMAVEAIRRE